MAQNSQASKYFRLLSKDSVARIAVFYSRSCRCQQQLLLTWKRPVFILAHQTSLAVLERCPKSSAIHFVVKTFDCLLT